MISCVDHVAVLVADLERTSETYSRLLGVKPSWRGSHPDLATANTLFKLANTYLELIAPVGDGALADALRARLEASGEGPLALALRSDNLEATIAALRSRGIAAPDPTEGRGRDERSGAERRWRSSLLPVERTRGVLAMIIEHRPGSAPLPRAEPTAASGSVVEAIDHVVVMTGSAEETIALYGDALGLRLALDRTFEQRKLRLLFFRVGGSTIEYAAAVGDGAAELGPRLAPGDADRFWGISYRVPDIDAARARVAAAGFDVSEVRTGLKPATRVCTVRDPTHGVATLFIGPDAPA